MSASIYKDAARFFARIDWSTDCWLWKGLLTKDGYAVGSYGSRRNGDFVAKGAIHRWMWEYVTQEKIPAGYQIDHLCHVRRCVNPAHLEPVTHAVNQSRKWAKREPQDYCMSGRHLLSETAKFQKNGKRFCGVCVAEKKHQKYLERKAARKAALA